MNDNELRYETRGDIGVITLNRPEARNALTLRTYAALEEAVRSTEARCLVITGADPAFCSGDDVKSVMGGGERPESGAIYCEQVERECAALGTGRLVTIIGRFWSLDREENWDRIEKTYHWLVEGKGRSVPMTS